MKKRDGDIASLFQKIAAKRNPSSSLIPSNDAMDHDGDIGPLVRTTSDSRISVGGDIVPLVNLIIDSRTSEKCGQQWHTYSIFDATTTTAIISL
jgi:hypothetical protein